MAKNISEYLEEIKKFTELAPNQKMALLFGKTPSGKYVPLKVDNEGRLDIKGARLSPTVTVAAVDTYQPNKDSADFVCTGENDQETIMEAINSLPDTGGRVLLLEGTYKINGTIDISNKSNITLEGMGDSTLLDWIAGTTDTPAILIQNSSNIAIKNLAIDQHYTGTAVDGSHAIDIRTSENVVVSNCLFKNIVEFAVHIIGESGNYTKKIMVVNNRFENGYSFSHPDWYLEDCIIQGNIVKDANTGLLVEYNQKRTQIINNIFYVTNLGIGFGAENGIISNNIIVGSTWNGMVISSTAVGAVITGNSLSCNGGNGIVCEAYRDVSIVNNVITGADTGISVTRERHTIKNNLVSNCTVGIDVDCAYASIVGNTIRNIQQEAIKIRRSGDYSVIKGNVIINAGVEANNTYSAIYLEGDSRDNLDFPFILDNYIVSYNSNLYKYAIEVGSYVDYPWTIMNKYKRGATGGIYNPSGFDYENFEVIA